MGASGAAARTTWAGRSTAEQVAEVLKFFDWAYKSGDKLASDLDYVPLPDKASDQVRQVWSKEIKGKDGKPLFAAKGS